MILKIAITMKTASLRMMEALQVAVPSTLDLPTVAAELKEKGNSNVEVVTVMEMD
jgi:hypothetical protein